MNKFVRLIILVCFNIILSFLILYSSPTIPGDAWSRDIAASGYKDGAPIGGFGAGTITWKLDGNFYFSRLDIGNGNDNGSFTASDTNAHFYFYQKPSSGAATTKKLNAETLGSGQARYYSLFPFAWVDYYGSQFNVKAKVTQFSPLIPNDYQRVSYPLGIYEWELTNSTSENYDAAVMLIINNPYGASASLVSSGNYTGIVLNKSGSGAPTLETQGEFCLASISSANVTVSRMSSSNLSTIESDFSADGVLSNTVGSNTLGAVAFKVTLSPGQSVRIPIVLSWDIPIAQAGSGQKWYRKYTKHFNRNGTNSWAIAQEALTNHSSWETQLDNWQNEILENPYYPSWLKSMLFNELYIYFTGGTYWEDGSASGYPDNANENMFSHLESYIYDFYGTSDVRFYGSWALFLNWPDIDKQCVKQFCDSVYHTRTDRPAYLNTTAHDFGNRDTVFTQWNAYTYRDSTNWKDLNSKLVLMVYRDWHLTGRTDSSFLNYCWEPVKRAMAKVKSQDTDGDGLPNSSGIDQTYDDMDLTGDTSYCGSLFLAACLAAKEIALAMGDNAQATTYQSWFDLARPNFESQLWTGQYYRIDTGSHDPNRIMSDQLCGQWYAKACELPDIVVNTRAVSAFQKIYDNNFSLFGSGSHGVVNVMNSNGTIDTSTPQTQECWVGTSWGVVAGMVHHGMTSQANAIGQSLYNTIWNNAQYWFRTPEAWRVNLTSPRAFYYMRASTVWAVKRAYDRLPYLCSPNTCTPPPTATFTRTPTPTATINPCASSYLRVNCGGPAATDSQGRSWSADQAYTSGGWGYVNGSAETIVSNPIANTEDDVLYQSGRWNSTLEYRFTLSNKAWRVRLKFAEIYSPFTNPGQRVFNVFIEGNQVLSSFDIVASSGGQYTAIDYTFDVNLTDGILNITTSAIIDSPKISAIEILDPSILCTPTVTRTGTPPTPTRTLTITPTWTRTPYLTFTATRTNTPFLSPTITRTPTISPTFTITPSITPIRVNCGGPQYNDGTNIWLADQAYVSGGWGYVNGTAATTTDAIAGTTHDTLYQSERYASNLEYRFTLPNGQYQVNLKFVEMYWTSNNARVFSVAIEGVTVISNLDIYAAVGHDVACDRGPFTVTVTDGVLNIVCSSTVDNAQMCAIEILPIQPTPTFTGTNTRTPTSTSSQIATNNFTATRTNTSTWTRTATGTYTRTGTPTWTRTATSSQLPTNSFTPTRTRTSTWTWTITPTYSFTYTNSPSLSPTPTLTLSPSPTVTDTRTVSPTITQTWTGTPPSPTITLTRTLSWTTTNTPTLTATPSFSYTRTVTLTGTGTPSNTQVITNTFTATLTRTISTTFTYTISATASPTRTWTNSVSSTQTPSYTRTNTMTLTISLSSTATRTPTYTRTPTMTITMTGTVSPTATQTWTGTPPTSTDTPSVTPSSTITVTFTHTGTSTSTWTVTVTMPSTQTPSASATTTSDMTPSFTFTSTASASLVPTNSETPTRIATSSQVATYSFTATRSPTASSTFNVQSATWTNTRTTTPTNSQLPTTSYTPTRTITSSWTQTVTSSQTPSASATDTVDMTPTLTVTVLASLQPTISFTATPDSNQQQAIDNVVIYPNPINPDKDDYCRVTFKIYNKNIDKLTASIYTSGYRLIKEIILNNEQAISAANNGFMDIEIKDLKTLSNSVYYYYIKIQQKDIVFKSKIEKIIILR